MAVHPALATLAALGVGAVAVAPAAAAPRTHVVVIDQMKFGPVPAQLRKGDRIVWVNRDIFRHSATAANKSFDIDLPPSSQRLTVIRSAGRIAVVCKYHPGMRTALRAA